MFASVNWSAPWFEPWREVGEQAARRVAQGLPLHEALNRQGGAPIRFAPQSALPAGQAYERFIFERKQCPTRPNLHDFFNGLCWLRLPLAKQKLNELQAAQIGGLGIAARRGPVRDAITIFDENGALLAAPAPLWDALAARQWRRLFIELRPLWREARVLVFGHALLEKLVTPRKELTAHVWAANMPAGDLAQVDRWLAAELTPARLAQKPFAPLPLAGVPLWCPENENFSFYDDSLVFRTARRKEPKTTAPHDSARP